MTVPSLVVVSTGLVVQALGGGFTSLTRSLATSLVNPKKTGQLYAMVSVLDASSALSAGPMISWLFLQGIALGGDWLCLPYLGVAFICFVVTVAVCTGRTKTLGDENIASLVNSDQYNR